MHTGTRNIRTGKQRREELRSAVIKVQDCARAMSPSAASVFPSFIPQRLPVHLHVPSSPPGTGDGGVNKRTKVLSSQCFSSRGKRQAIDKEISETCSVSECDQNKAGKEQRELSGGWGRGGGLQSKTEWSGKTSQSR